MKQASAPSRWRAPRCSFPLRVRLGSVGALGSSLLCPNERTSATAREHRQFCRSKSRGKSGEWRVQQKNAHDFNAECGLHTGEVQGSIPCASTRTVNEIRYFCECDLSTMADHWHVHAEQSTKWRAVTCRIRAVYILVAT